MEADSYFCYSIVVFFVTCAAAGGSCCTCAWILSFLIIMFISYGSLVSYADTFDLIVASPMLIP
jgi:hypothetical protein